MLEAACSLPETTGAPGGHLSDEPCSGAAWPAGLQQWQEAETFRKLLRSIKSHRPTSATCVETLSKAGLVLWFGNLVTGANCGRQAPTRPCLVRPVAAHGFPPKELTLSECCENKAPATLHFQRRASIVVSHSLGKPTPGNFQVNFRIPNVWVTSLCIVV